jgi:site-specific DNA-cytosine methylase
MLKDIIQDAITERDKSYCIDANYEKSGTLKCYQEKGRRQLVQVPEATAKGYAEIAVGQCCDFTQPNSKTRRGRAMIDKSNCLCTSFDFRQLVRCGAFRGRNPDNPASRESRLPTKQMLEIREDGKTNTLTTVQKDNVCVQIGTANIKGNEQIKRVYSPEAKSPCLTTMGGGNREPKITQDNVTWRKLTVTECERLQTLPDGYCRAVSNSRAYHAIGNGWTVDVIAHIFNCLKIIMNQKEGK